MSAVVLASTSLAPIRGLNRAIDPERLNWIARGPHPSLDVRARLATPIHA